MNGSRAAKGYVHSVEEPESYELFADVGKEADQKAVEDLVEVKIAEKNPDKFFLLGSSLSSIRGLGILEL